MKSIKNPRNNKVYDWIETDIASFAPFVYGKGLSEEKRNHYGHVPVYGSNGIIGFHDMPLVENPTVIIGRKGTVGAVHFCECGCWPIDTTFYHAGEDVDSVRYTYYVLKSVGLNEMNSDSAVPGLNRDSAHARIIRIPSDVTEQRRIAHILGTLDDKIENNRKTAKTLEAMAQAIFKSWFVDFDPVRAKMAGGSRESICKRLKLTPEILDLFPDRLVESELGEIPEGWRVEMLNNLAALVTDSISPRRSPNTVFEHYSIPAFDAGRTPAMELGESIKSNKYVVKRSAVLVSKLNPHTPRIWLPAIGEGAALCSTEFMQFVPREREDRPYLYCLMISQSMQEEVLKHVTGSTGSRQRAQPSQIAKVRILSPQSCVQKAFTQQASPMLHAVAENLTASRTLAALRDTLLPKLISGKIRVPEFEHFLQSTQGAESC